jgi:hypothetical protein
MKKFLTILELLVTGFCCYIIARNCFQNEVAQLCIFYILVQHFEAVKMYTIINRDKYISIREYYET